MNWFTKLFAPSEAPPPLAEQWLAETPEQELARLTAQAETIKARRRVLAELIEEQSNG